MKSSRRLVALGALGIAISVALGAFGAHGLKDILKPDYLNTFDTGVKYQLYHCFAIVIIGILMNQNQEIQSKLKISYYLFLVGILLFSGSLYLLTYFRIGGNEGMNWLGAIAPIGGLSFIAAWLNVTFWMFKSDAK